MSFSQRRKKGFRNAFEFDHKRVLVADEKQLQVFGFSEQISSLSDPNAVKDQAAH
jgi:hypothetical protein